MNSYSVQPFLIDVLPPAGTIDERREAKRVTDRLLKVRRTLKPNQEKFYEIITETCDKIRSLSKMSDTQKEELILYSIERQGGVTPTEIAEDTKLHITIVKTLLDKLYDDGKVYFANRHVPLSGRQWTMIKSRRVKSPEVE